ncbi:NAD(P)-dependent oxidoreductase [Ornithinimicrobium sp. LYQ121]|uniref:NAD(P)-dependent oxidoreductase n=1 Tax=Ornithinimicrobium sp. LYQ121 TaxID=3378801 RepID=UPI003853BD34
MGNDPEKTPTIGFLGLGPMGLPMARALAEGGFEVVAWNRHPERVDDLARTTDRAVVPASCPREVSERTDAVISMLPDLPQLVDRLDGPDGLLAGWSRRTAPGQQPLLVVMSTVSPVAVVELGGRLAREGVRLVDAPVSGGPTGAHERTLSIMVGGAVEDVESLTPGLRTMGSTVRHMGQLGAGSLTKACNQAVVAATLAGLGEALRLARAGGLDLDSVLEILDGGLAGSTALRLKRERYLSDDFTGGGSCRNQLKDLGFVLESGRRYDLDQPVSRLTHQLYARLVEDGDGELDHSAVLKAF